MMATRFSTVGWTGCVCVAALAFYLVSQTVAAKRAELVTIDRKIIGTQREIAQLETEIGTRGGMAQIENWNSRVYGLQAPGAEQFVNSSVQLVAMADPHPLPLDPVISPPHGPVEQASLTVEAPAVAVVDKPVTVAAEAPDVAPAERPMIRQATYITPQRVAMAPDEANLRKTSYSRVDTDADDKPAVVKPAAIKAAVAKVPAVKAVAANSSKPKGATKTEPRAERIASKDAKEDAKTSKGPKEKDTRTPKAAMKMTALDDKWLAEATADPAAKRSHKGRP
jgi:hypothetical protein